MTSIPAAVKCSRCGLRITYYKGLWWSSDDDFSCPDGEERHEP